MTASEKYTDLAELASISDFDVLTSSGIFLGWPHLKLECRDALAEIDSLRGRVHELEVLIGTWHGEQWTGSWAASVVNEIEHILPGQTDRT
jgi:hypothetical protein